MYSYLNGYIKRQQSNSLYEQYDLSQMIIGSILNIYSEAYLVLTHPMSDHPYTLNLADILPLITTANSGLTVVEWLVLNADRTLPTQNGEPELVVRSAKYADCYNAGYKADAVIPGGNPLNDGPNADRHDIWIRHRKETVDYLDMRKHVLGTCNGYIHRMDADDRGLYLIDAGRSFRTKGFVSLGLISFADLGSIETYSITDEMIYHQSEHVPYSKSFYLDLPVDISNKSIGLVIGGYMHLMDYTHSIVGNRTLKINFKSIPFMERYMVDRGAIDLSVLSPYVYADPEHPNVFSTEGFYSEECIRKYMTLSQSFIVVFDCLNINIEPHPLTPTHLPGRFVSHSKPVWPLRTQLGLWPEYVTHFETDRYLLSVDNNLYHHRTMNTFDHRERPLNSDAHISHLIKDYHHGDLLQISSQRLVVKPPEA